MPQQQPAPSLLVTIGEAMVVLVPEAEHPLAEAVAFGSDVGGAEFNVATSVARQGLPTAFVSRLGDDGFGDRVLRVAAEAGVDVTAVQRDPERPTGLYVKERLADARGITARMHYYRRASAASALSAAQLRAEPAADLLRRASHVHISGITAALSSTAAAACASLRKAVGPHTAISVDLNFRPRLWQNRDTTALHELIAQADLLFAGADEAEAFFGHVAPERILSAFPGLDALVLKEDSVRASVHRRNGRTAHVPCLTVEVVEPVGAGDAFAAGFLTGIMEGRGDEAALMLGHALAAATLVVPGDRPVAVPDRAARDRIAGTERTGWLVTPDRLPWRLG